MRTAAAKAIELDPNLGEAHAAMALIKFADWDWAGAEQEARRAIALNPDVDSHLSDLLSITGRHAEAIAVAEHAVKVDPLSPADTYDYGIALYFARRYDDALAQLKRSIDLEPRNYAATLMLGACLRSVGETTGGVGRLRPPRIPRVAIHRPGVRAGSGGATMRSGS